MKRLILILAAVSAMGADHCAMHGQPVSYVRKAPVAKLDPLAWTRLENIIGYVSAAAAAPVSDFCDYHKAFDRWMEWRRANPKAHSKWHPESDKKGLSFQEDEMAGEPGDYSAFGGCGCPLEKALGPNGCGWIHSQVWY